MNPREHWDVVVIGAGPAGSCAAWSAARTGLRTLLVERAEFPREKVCGCCLNPASLHEIAEMGLTPALHELGAIPLHAMELIRGSKAARIRIPRGAAISRAALDGLLLAAAVGEGANLLTPAHARVGDPDPRGARTVFIRSSAGEYAVDANVVIVAEGLAGSSLAGLAGAEVIEARGSAIGVGTRIEHPFERGVVRMLVCEGGYLGLVALPGGVVDAAGCVDPTVLRRAGGPAAWAKRACDHAGLDPSVRDALARARWSGTPRLTRRRANVELPGILVAGDSAGYVEPFTGEGISWAMHAGLRAGAVAHRVCARQFRSGEWHAWWQREFRPRRIACGLVRSALRQPLLAGGVIALASTWPTLSNGIAARFGTRWRSEVAAT